MKFDHLFDFIRFKYALIWFEFFYLQILIIIHKYLIK